jgi:hypothetical protein
LPLRLPLTLSAVAFALLLCGAGPVRAQTVASEPELIQGSLHELKGKRAVLLVVARSEVLDAREPGRSIIESAYKTTLRQSQRYRFTYNTFAKKLNSYMKKHGSITAVEHAADADFIVFFNLLEYRRSLGVYYAYGETYVISNHPPSSGNPPRILWKSRKVMWAEDSANELIKDLKAARGEK